MVACRTVIEKTSNLPDRVITYLWSHTVRFKLISLLNLQYWEKVYFDEDRSLKKEGNDEVLRP